MNQEKIKSLKDVDFEAGIRITELRESRHLTQKDVTALLREMTTREHMSDNTLSKYEMGQCSIKGDVLIALARIYNVTTDYILTGEKPKIWLPELKVKEILKKAEEIKDFIESILFLFQ